MQTLKPPAEMTPAEQAAYWLGVSDLAKATGDHHLSAEAQAKAIRAVVPTDVQWTRSRFADAAGDESP